MRRLIASPMLVPMLVPMLLMLAGCHRAGDETRGEAKALIASHCSACHVVPGVRTAVGRVGPRLSDIARQQIIAGHFANNRSNMILWLMHPQVMSPGNAMPEMGLSERQAAVIADYLYSLDKT